MITIKKSLDTTNITKPANEHRIMSIEKALCQEVEALLANKPPSINTKPATPLSRKKRCEDQPSMFQTTWQIINNPFDARITGEGATIPPTTNNNNDDFSDLSACLSGINRYPYKCQLADGDPDDDISLQSFELSETGLLTQANSVGSPSLHSSAVELENNNAGDVANTDKPSKLRKRHSSRILDHTNNIGLNNNPCKDIPRNLSPFHGLNTLLDSRTSVGSTYKSSSTNVVPRCAYDYLMRVKDSEHDKKPDEIPANIYKYPETVKEPQKKSASFSETPVLREQASGKVPMNKTFLDSINEQIQHIKYEQAKERLMLKVNTKETGDVMPETLNFDSRTPIIGENTQANWSEPLIFGNGTTPIPDRFKTPIGRLVQEFSGRPVLEQEVSTTQKVDLSIQTNTSNLLRSLDSPDPWGDDSKVDSQISVTVLNARRLGSRISHQKQTFYPLTPPPENSISQDCIIGSRALPRSHLHRSSSFFGNFFFKHAVGITKYSLQTAWNTAEEVFYGCIVPPEIENEPPIEEDFETNEDKIAVSVMRLMGVPVGTRHAIYREVLGEIQAINDFSVGTIQAINSVIDWICTGKHAGTEDLIAKTRLLCTCQTEVDPDSESWKCFERDMCIFTNAVVSTVGNAARAVSRQYSNDSNDSLDIGPASSPASQSCIEEGRDFNTSENQGSSSTLKYKISDSIKQSSNNVRSDPADYDAPVNPDLIAQIVTASEFDLPITPVVPESESNTSKLSVKSDISRRRSKIPVRVDSSKHRMDKDADDNFNLHVLKSALRHNCQDTISSETHIVNQVDATPSSRTERKPESKKTSYYSYAKAYRESQFKSEDNSDTSDCSLRTTSKFGLGKDFRESLLCPGDQLLLQECRRLTSLENSNDPLCRTIEESLYEPRNETPRPDHANLGGMCNEVDSPMLHTEIAQIASVVASVAASVTSTLLSRASSAASYIPSFSDTFGPQVDVECRLPECAPEDSPSSLLDSIQQAASNMIFGCDKPICRTQRPVRSHNRFAITTDRTTNLLQAQEDPSGTIPGNHYASKSSISLCSNDPDPAWELFDYIKRGEADKEKEKLQMVTRKLNEGGIVEEAPPSNLHLASPSSTEPSITARLSKAALTGLFNTFRESSTVVHPVSGIARSSINVAQQDSIIQPRMCPSPTPTQCCQSGRKYRTSSGHNYILNSRMSASHANLKPNNSKHTLYAPQNSDAGFDRTIAQLRVREDFALLEKRVQQYYSDKLQHDEAAKKETCKPPVPIQQRSRSYQQSAGRSKIPRFDAKQPHLENKSSKPAAQTRTSNLTIKSDLASTVSLDASVKSYNSVQSDFSTSSFEFCSGPGSKGTPKLKANTNVNNGRPKIMHPVKPPVSNRTAPMKSKTKVQVLDVPHPKPPQPTPKYTVSYASCSPSVVASRTSSHLSTNGNSDSKSYLNMAKQKEKTVCSHRPPPGRGIGSYSSTNRHIQQYGLQEGVLGIRKNDKSKSQAGKKNDFGYKNEDETHKLNAGSSLSASTCSTGPVRTVASANCGPGSCANNNTKISYFDNAGCSSEPQLTNAPVFFPSLDNTRLPLPPILTNPFSRFRSDTEAGKSAPYFNPVNPDSSKRNL